MDGAEVISVSGGSAEAERLLAAFRAGKTAPFRGRWYRVHQAIVDEAGGTVTFAVEAATRDGAAGFLAAPTGRGSSGSSEGR